MIYILIIKHIQIHEVKIMKLIGRKPSYGEQIFLKNVSLVQKIILFSNLSNDII